MGDAASVKCGINHQPVELAAVRSVDGRNNVAGKVGPDEGRSEILIGVTDRSDRSLGTDPDHTPVRLDLVRPQIVAVERRVRGSLGQRGDVFGADPLERFGIAQQFDQDCLR